MKSFTIPQHLYKEKLYSEKLELLFKNSLISVPSSLFCAAIVFVALYRIPHSDVLIYWFMASIVMTICRLGFTAYYLRDPKPTAIRFYLFFSATVVAAVLWGIAGSVLMPQNHLIEQMIVIVVIAGVTAGGIQSLQASLLASLAYISLILVPLCAWIFVQDEIAYTILGLSFTLYFLFTIVVSLRGTRFLNETLKLKYENLSLAEDLSKANIELKQSNQELIEKETNLRLIHDNAPIGMAVISLDGDWLSVNTKLCQILGYSKEELEKLTLNDITFKDDIDTDMDRKSKLLAGRLSSYQIEKRFVNKEDQLIWILANVSLVRNKQGQPLYFISQIQDINDRKLNERLILGLNNMNEKLQLCHHSAEAYPIISNAVQNLFTEFSGGLTIYNKASNEQERVGLWGSAPLLKSYFKTEDCWAFRSGKIYVVDNPSREFICDHFETIPSGGSICIPLIVQDGIIGMLNFTAASHCKFSPNDQQILNSFSEVIKLSLANIHLNEILRKQAIHDH